MLYTWLKFGHLLGLALLMSGVGIELVAYARLRRVTTVAELRTWQRLPMERLADGGMVLLVLTGLAMAGQSWSFTDGWILTTLLLLVVFIVAGALIGTPRLRRLREGLAAADDGAAPPDLLAAARDPVLHALQRATLPLVAEIIFLMVHKPAAGGILVSLLVAAVAGAAVGWPLIRGGRTAAAPPVV